MGAGREICLAGSWEMRLFELEEMAVDVDLIVEEGFGKIRKRDTLGLTYQR